MLPVKRYRWTPKRLIARYSCPNCGSVTGCSVHVAPVSEHDRHALVAGRPGELICLCGVEMEYVGLEVAE